MGFRGPRRRGAPASILLALLLAGCGDARDAAAPPPGRIILLSMDTVRADFVEGWGGRDTPHIRALAEGGVRFRDSFAAASYTLPSHMSMFTGLDPAAHGVLNRKTSLSPAIPTLAERLSTAGYRTRGFHEGGFIADRYGFARGFEAFEELPRVSLVRENLGRVLATMRETAQEPYFLFLHTYAAHGPFGGYERYRRSAPERGLPTAQEIRRLDHGRGGPGAPTAAELSPEQRSALLLYNQLAEAYDQQARSVAVRLPRDFVGTPNFRGDIAAVRDAYRRRVQEIDAAVGSMEALLEELGQRDDTLWILTSDHGEAFFEHGLYSHGYVPFDEVMRVPLVFRYPPLTGSGGREVTGPVWHLDLMPTILSLVGVEPPLAQGARDLREVLAGRDALPADRTLFPLVMEPVIEGEPPRRIAVRGNLKLIQGHEVFGDERGLLFDLERDPQERENRRAQRPDAVRELVGRFGAYQSQLRAPAPAARPTPLTDEEREALRALGYAD